MAFSIIDNYFSDEVSRRAARTLTKVKVVPYPMAIRRCGWPEFYRQRCNWGEVPLLLLATFTFPRFEESRVFMSSLFSRANSPIGIMFWETEVGLWSLVPSTVRRRCRRSYRVLSSDLWQSQHSAFYDSLTELFFTPYHSGPFVSLLFRWRKTQRSLPKPVTEVFNSTLVAAPPIAASSFKPWPRFHVEDKEIKNCATHNSTLVLL